MSLAIAQQSITAAAEHHRRLSNQCAALAGMIQAIKPQKDEPMPVESLAKALLPLGLCIVHRDLVRDCLTIVEQTEDAEGLSGDELRRLDRGLNSALKGGAA